LFLPTKLYALRAKDRESPEAELKPLRAVVMGGAITELIFIPRSGYGFVE